MTSKPTPANKTPNLRVKPRDSSEEPVDRTPLNVSLPPVDATPEEIVQALFQRPPLKKPKDEKSGSDE